jgi:hypothetical protein
MKYSVITSFNDEGFHHYGKRFIETFEKHWPKEVELLIFHEGELHPEIERHSNYNLMEVGQCVDFINTNKDVPLFNGKHINQPSRWKSKCVDAGYNFRFDAVKFCRKVFAIYKAATIALEGKMFWVDADVITFNNVSLHLLDMVMPDDYDTSHLKRPGAHSECGFVGYNLEHIATWGLIRYFADLYVTGGVFNLKEWHDSFVYDYCLDYLSIDDYVIPSTNRGHVFINSELGEYMDHLKGDRKFIGRSLSVDVKVPRKHEYWRFAQ